MLTRTQTKVTHVTNINQNLMSACDTTFSDFHQI